MKKTHPYQRIYWTRRLVVALILSAVGYLVWQRAFDRYQYGPEISPEELVQAKAETEPVPSQVVAEKDDIRLKNGDFSGRKTIFNQLADAGLTGGTIRTLVSSLTPYYNFRKCRPDHRWTITFKHDEAVKFTLEVGPTEIYEVESLHQTPTVSKRKVDTYYAVETVRGRMEGSLIQSLDGYPQQAKLALALAEVFAYDIDFYQDPQRGDTFEFLVESQYVRTELGDRFLSYGKILAARYFAKDAAYDGYLFNKPDGTTAYYNSAGKSLARDMLRSPLKFQNITSSFNKNRFHPVLKQTRAHNGVDYGAPLNTPVMAVANGRVVRAGRMGGAGIAVELEHRGDILTQYFHLNSIAANVRVGSRVTQGQVVGYVGKTGYATGYHLHFGMKIRGNYVDPVRQKFQPSEPLKGQEMEYLKSQINAYLLALDPLSSSSESLASMPVSYEQLKHNLRM